MSVLIKGMEMPTSCRACPLATRFFDGEDVCAMLGTYVHDRDREDDCPLVPVPPHGRLGNLKQAVIILERLRDHCGNEDMAYALNWAANTIRDLPTIIPAEEGE